MKASKIAILSFAAFLAVAPAIVKATDAVKKVVTHFIVYNLDKKAYVAYDSGKDVQVWVIGPEGEPEPAVVIAEKADGSAVLVTSADTADAILNSSPADPNVPDPHSQQQKATPNDPMRQSTKLASN